MSGSAPSHVLMILLLLTFFCASFAEASSGSNNPNTPTNHNLSGNQGRSSIHEIPHYSLINQHVSFDPNDDSVSLSAETEAVTFYSDDEDIESSPSSSTSVLFGGCSIFSSDALSCSGGDLSGGSTGSPAFIAMAECSFGTRGLDSDMEYDSEDDDDDDDEDDDGHSSMLSNASLRRSRALANGMPSGRTSVFSHGGSADRRNRKGLSRETVTMAGMNGCKGSKSLLSALRIRGGAEAAQDGSEFAKRLFVAAVVTLLYEAVNGHLLEFIKIVMQTSPPGTSYGEVLRSITAEKGIVGIWDGFVPWGVIQAVLKGGVFGFAHAVALSYLLPLADKGIMPKQLALTLAGGIGGGFQGYVLSPTLLLKTRVMTDPVFREKMSLLRTTLLSFRIGFDVVSNEGIGALMKGSSVFALKRVFDWATRYYFSDVFEALLLRHSSSGSLTPGEKVTASLLGGTASTLVTLPLDVLVAKIQDAKKAGERVSALELFKNELEESGWRGLKDNYMRGFEARLAHVCLTTVAMKTGTAFLYDFLFDNKN